MVFVAIAQKCFKIYKWTNLNKLILNILNQPIEKKFSAYFDKMQLLQMF